MSTIEGGGDEFPGVRVADVDRVGIADLSSIQDYRVMHMNEMTTHQIVFRDGGRVVVSVNADGRIGGLSRVGEGRHRLEGRSLVLEG